MSETVAILVEASGAAVDPVALELAALAREICAATGAEPLAIVAGPAAREAAEALASASGMRVIGVDAPEPAGRVASELAPAVGAVVVESRARIVLLADGAWGWDVAPALAVRVGAACITGVDGWALEDGALLWRRKIYGGKIDQHVAADTPAVVTVRPGSFRPAAVAGSPGAVEMRTAEPGSGRVRFLGERRSFAKSAGLTEAEVVVTAGRGVGGEEGLAVVRRLAACFARSAVAGSRPVCDAGWLEYARQVGATGSTVSPALYVACGVSGASQHVQGMRGAGFVVAVNSDPDAAIFQHADVCVVEDLHVFLPPLADLLAKDVDK